MTNGHKDNDIHEQFHEKLFLNPVIIQDFNFVTKTRYFSQTKNIMKRCWTNSHVNCDDFEPGWSFSFIEQHNVKPVLFHVYDG